MEFEMMGEMMGEMNWMMGGMIFVGLLALVVLVLAAAALLKYLLTR